MASIEIAAGVLLLAGAIFVAALIQARLAIRVAENANERVGLDEVQGLRDECITVFERAFAVRLDLEDFEESARALSGQMDQANMVRRSFAKEDFDWYCVLPLGAFLGELLRVHANGSWRAGEHGGLELMIPIGEENERRRPFDEVLQHLTSGKPGAIYARLDAARQPEKTLDG